MNQKILILFILSILFASCKNKKLEKFEKRLTYFENMSKTPGISKNLISSYIDSLKVLTTQIEMSEIEIDQKKSLKTRLGQTQVKFRSRRSFECLRSKTIRYKFNYNKNGDEEIIKVNFISVDSVTIYHDFEYSELSAFQDLASLLYGNKKSKNNLPKKFEHSAGLKWKIFADDPDKVLLLISDEDNNTTNTNHNNREILLEVNDEKCTYTTLYK